MAVVLFSTSCTVPPEEEGQPVQETSKRLTVYLLDASGSFNKQQRGGLFNGSNYFDLACEQVRYHLQTASINEVIFVNSISSSSQDDGNLGLSLDLSQFDINFKEPEPKNIFLHKKWEQKRDTFHAPLKAGMAKAQAEAVEKLEIFRKNHSARPSDDTDLYNAIWLASEIFESPSYKNYESRLIIFSDFLDTKTETTRQILLPGVIVVGKFVSRNSHTPESYDRLKERWRHLLSAKGVEFFPPEQSN